MSYLQEDIPKLEADYQRFAARLCEETADVEWNFRNFPAVQILEKFDADFSSWVTHLMDLDWLRKAGYPLQQNDLSYVEWKCLALISQWPLNRGCKK